MSLLMKALEKAAQERDKTPAAAPRFSLETVEVRPPASARANTVPEDIPSASSSTPPYTSPATTAHPTSRTGIGGANSAATGASPANENNAQTRAAAVLTAAAPAADPGALAKLMARPVYLIGALAGLVMLGYGAYVYVQIAHPTLLIKSTPRTQPAPVAATPAPATVPAPVASQPADAPPGMVTMESVLRGRNVPTDAPVQQAAPAASTAGTTGGAVPPHPPSAASSTAPTAQAGTLPPVKATTAPAPAAPAGPMAPRVAISQGDAVTPRINATINEAYNALLSRQFDTAQRLYNQALLAEPKSIDALLGLAAIAQHDNRPDDAQRYFLAILDVEPRHALAQSGLIALISRADPQAAETRLKQLIAREPSAPLYFNLGNVHAEQSQWPQAQQAYFQAHSLDPRNPDYAYNLAVGLEHLGQQKIALDYYRKALQLASEKSAGNFDSARLQTRIAQLAERTK